MNIRRAKETDLEGINSLLWQVLQVHHSGRPDLFQGGKKKKYTDQEGHRKQRNKLFERTSELHIVIADTDEAKVEEILTKFLKSISKGLEVNGNWVDIEIGKADWVEGDDSILKSKIAVEFDVILTGGIYVDTDVITAKVGSVEADKE